MPFERETGNVGAPDSSTPFFILTFLSVITQFNFAFSPTTVSCIKIEFLTTAPFPILTPLNMIEFSTVPSIIQPSAASEFVNLDS